MLRLSRKDIADLAVSREDSCVSFFLPTHRSTREVRQGAIRLKNLVREATEQLIASGKRPAEARALLDPVRRLAEAYWFWQHQKEGLAVFVSPKVFRYYQVARTFPELTLVARRFHLRPLLQLLSEDAVIYVLALGQSQVRLYEVGIDGVDEAELGLLPESVIELLRTPESKRQLQFHTRTPGVQGRPPVFHGHGDETADQKQTLLHLFREIDKRINDFLGPGTFPLILAGVPYYLPLYREASRYPRLVEQGITGSAEHLQPDEVYREARRLAQPIIDQARNSAFERYRNLTGTGKTANAIEPTLHAAHQGRVENLFVREGRHVWGVYDSSQEQVIQEPEATADNEDLLDLAAVQVLLNGGAVYMLDDTQMPDSGDMAAVLRY